jgi:hydroxypyruvate isomerase
MPLSASITFMFRELPLLERFAAARSAGFDGVEIQRLAEGDVDEMARAARDAGIEVVLINVASGDYADGGDGLSGVRGCEEAFREALEQALDAAGALGAHHVHLGPSRIPAGQHRDACLRTYEANIRLALSLSRAARTSLLIEAMNRVEAPTALVADPEQGAEIVRSVSSPRLGLQFDVYHAAMNGLQPADACRQVQPVVRHVQYADAPGRHEPGTGALDLPSILAAIVRCGYGGWFGAEYHPQRTTREGLGWVEALRQAVRP